MKEKQNILDQFKEQPNIFDPKNISARQVFLSRHEETKSRALRRIAIADQKFDFYSKLVVFDRAMTELNFELSVICFVYSDYDIY